MTGLLLMAIIILAPSLALAENVMAGYVYDFRSRQVCGLGVCQPGGFPDVLLTPVRYDRDGVTQALRVFGTVGAGRLFEVRLDMAGSAAGTLTARTVDTDPEGNRLVTTRRLAYVPVRHTVRVRFDHAPRVAGMVEGGIEIFEHGMSVARAPLTYFYHDDMAMPHVRLWMKVEREDGPLLPVMVRVPKRGIAPGTVLRLRHGSVQPVEHDGPFHVTIK